MIGNHRKKPLHPCQRGGAAFIALCLLAAPLASAGPPLRDRIRVAAVVLYQGDSQALEAPLEGDPFWTAKEDMPYSADLYLRPSGLIDSTHPEVLKAMRAVRLEAAGTLGPSPVFDDPRATLAAIHAWLDKHVEAVGLTQDARRQATTWSGQWPKASQVLKQGNGDAFGRVRALCAVARAFKIPTRPCWYAGRPAAQFWVQPKGRKGKPRGYWMLDRERVPGQGADAWSIIPGDFEYLMWEPRQELRATPLAFEQAYYPMEISATAREDFEASSALGRLSACAAALAAPPAPPQNGEGEGGKTPYLRLVSVSYELVADGTLQAFRPLSILVPFVGHQDWNLEAAPRSPSRLKVVDKAFWTDRPARLTSRQPRDSWHQELPAMGYQFHLMVNLAKPRTLVSAWVENGILKGRTLRADNLARPQDASVKVRPWGQEAVALEPAVDPEGFFELALEPEFLEKPMLEVSAGRSGQDSSLWDVLLVPVGEISPAEEESSEKTDNFE